MNMRQGDRATRAVASPDEPSTPLADTQPRQCYSPRELHQQGVALHRFSPRWKSTLIVISLLAALVFIIAGTATTSAAQARAINELNTDPARGVIVAQDANRTQETLRKARANLILFGAGGVAYLLATALLIARIGPRNAQRPVLVQELSDRLQEKNDELKHVLAELRTTQDQVVSRQKLAELGELTAGVAHEIRNPLNLVQNFSRNSADMMAELKDTVAHLEGPPDDDQADLIDELTTELTDNMERIQQHGNRANRIVQGMLAMGRSTKGSYHDVNINELVEDHAMLAYHSARSRDPDFNVKIVRELDEDAGVVNVVSEDIGRVILNLVGNACYAAAERAQREPDHQPTMWLSTSRVGENVEIRVRDNGSGIPEDVKEKIFNPFFTTKPTDRGTGLGLSLSDDIVQQHGGAIAVDLQPGEYAEFTVWIPTARNAQAERYGERDDASQQ